MGFEFLFLKFIQESEEKDDDFDDWEFLEYLILSNFLQFSNDLIGIVMVNNMVNDNDFEVDIFYFFSDFIIYENLIVILFLIVVEIVIVFFLENLRVVLDKVLIDCGEFVLKQFYYFRLVVVFERFKFFILILDLFLIKKIDEFCVGSF